MPSDSHNRYMYGCVWRIDASTYPSIVGDYDLIKIDGNVRGCMRTLCVCPYIVLYCSGELWWKPIFGKFDITKI